VGRARVGMVCGAGAGKISQTPAGLERTQNFNPRRTLIPTKFGPEVDQGPGDVITFPTLLDPISV